ncbi:cytochrome D1 domain-containing protein [Methylotenera versatilis]|jgi:YVTN family beta-propeller protein|uniref:40-residue YVTN family beta-propeller repeat protein n=1 Tax=Methylotenera versatilis (strain 301) TaxID=666681 RepID=D7DKV7_METV0|nr:40-residue YVTN family beta-propeller repeat protein [Methylotenera versatilis 301]
MKLTHVVIAAAVSMSIGMNANAADRGKAYVSNQDGGVSVIDLNTLTSTTTIDVKGEGPRGLAVSDDGKLLVVATRENGSVSVIDTATNEVLSQIKVGQNPEFVRIKGNFAFVSYEPSAKGGPPPAPGSAEAAAAAKEDNDDDKEPARIGIIDLKLGKKIREITGGPETEGVEFSKDGKQLVITNEADNTVTVHSMKSGKLLKTIKTHEYGDRPRGVKVSPDGKTYLVTLEYGNKFMVMDKNFKVLRTVDTGATPYGISYDRKGERIFVAANKAKTLEVYDAKTYAKIKDIPTGNRCWHFTFTPDDKEVLLACGKSDAVFVIDAEKLEVKQQIEDKKMPWGVVTYPKSMGSLDTAIK